MATALRLVWTLRFHTGLTCSRLGIHGQFAGCVGDPSRPCGIDAPHGAQGPHRPDADPRRHGCVCGVADRPGPACLGPAESRLPDLATHPLCLPPLGRGARRQSDHGARRTRARSHVPVAGHRLHRRHGDLPDIVRPLYRGHGLEPQFADRPPLQRHRQRRVADPRRVFLERARQHGLLYLGGLRPIRHPCCSTWRSGRGSSSVWCSSCPSC